MDDFNNALSALGVTPQAPQQPSAKPSNNPGNLRPPGASKGFQSFSTPEDGLAAIDNNLKAYHGHGINSISGVINRWAPPSENNTGAYISDVSRRLGVHPDQQIDLSNPIVRQALTTAINLHENGSGILTRKSAATPTYRTESPSIAPAPATPSDDDFSSAISMYHGDAGGQAAPVAAPAAPVRAQSNSPSVAQTLAKVLPIPAVKLASILSQTKAPDTLNQPLDTSSLTDTGKSLAKTAIGFGDTVANGIGGMIKQVEYAGSRAYGNTPEEATRQSNSGIGSYFENPVSKFANSANRLLTGSTAKVEDSAAYKGESSQKIMQFVGENMSKGADWISGKTGLPKADVENMMNTAVAGVTPVIGKGVAKVGGNVVKAFDSASQELAGTKPLSSVLDAGKPFASGKYGIVSPETPSRPSAASGNGWNSALPQASVGAAGTSLDSRFSQTSPRMQAAYAAAKKDGPIDPVAAERHIAADSLNADIELTPGQSTGNIHLLSDEQNRRAQNPKYADRFNAQNEGLKKKLGTIQDDAAPDVFSTGPTSSGENMMGSYGVKDAALKKDISANYKALEDANGGDFPIDAKGFLSAADAALKQKMKTAYVPKEIAAQLEDFRNGAPMNFEQFEALRTNLSNEVRKAERSGDGNAAYASGLVRDALESMPLPPESAHLKPLADKARGSAKQRFDLLKNDPAYNASVNESISADKFIEKYVINGSKKDIKTMRENLSHDSAAQQQIAHATIEWLKKKGGLVDGEGTLSQAGYNKSLVAIKEKLGDLVGSEAASSLGTVGDVARWTQFQPKGSYVNNSGTFVAALKNNAIGTAENLGNAAAPFFNIGTTIRNKIDNRATAQSTKKTLEPGAGLVKLKDLVK